VTFSKAERPLREGLFQGGLSWLFQGVQGDCFRGDCRGCFRGVQGGCFRGVQGGYFRGGCFRKVRESSRPVAKQTPTRHRIVWAGWQCRKGARLLLKVYKSSVSEENKGSGKGCARLL